MKIFKHVYMEEDNGEGNQLAHSETPASSLDPAAQAIIDEALGTQKEEITKETPIDNNTDGLTDDSALPSESEGEGGEEVVPDDKKFAGKYKDVAALKDGIKNLKSTLPDYVIEGMSDEALEQHYTELNKDHSKQPKKTERKHSKTEEPAKEEKTPDEEAVAKKENLKVLFADFNTEFRSTGQISDTLYDSLEAAGIPSSVVDDYADKMVVEQNSFTQQTYELTGGEENFNKIKSWAEDGNIPASQLAAMQTMSYDQILLSMSGIKAKYDIANPDTIEKTDRITGKARVQNGGAGYKSQAGYLADVADPRYSKNGEYTRKVNAKFERSKF